MFTSDYLEGAHPAILEKLLASNLEQTKGYGLDPYSESAANKIKTLCQNPFSKVYFMTGGTQTNKTVISSMLRPHEAVISASTGHIATLETGAIESTGHKVIELSSTNGRLSAQKVAVYMQELLRKGGFEHIVIPKMVYISHPSEIGTTYTLTELENLSTVCKDYGLYLFVDGARLGYALQPSVSDATLKDLAALTDVFYIGGTKCGALLGEAVVLNHVPTQAMFRSMMKQNGALLAKGRLLGIQFDVLFTDQLYVKICAQAVQDAMRIRHAFEQKGISFLSDSATNCQFPMIPIIHQHPLVNRFGFTNWLYYNQDIVVLRYCTSWATNREAVDELVEFIASW